MINFRLEIAGINKLLMHNARLSDPLDPHTKRLAEITSKRKKTDEDHREMARREWLGALYWNATHGIHIPGSNIERMLLDAARLSRDGKTVERGLFVSDDYCRLIYQGPQSPETLIDNENFRFRASIKVGQQRVMRTRPAFEDWSLVANGHFDEDQISPDKLKIFVKRAGSLVGLGDWRPRYGRFEGTVTIEGAM
jgi:hypothetical protein